MCCSKMTSRLELDLHGPVTKLIMYVHWPSWALAEWALARWASFSPVVENINRHRSQCVNNLCSAKYEQSVKLTNNLRFEFIHHALSVMCKVILSTGCSCGANTLLSTHKYTNTLHELAIKRHAYTHRVDLQLVLSMTNGLVCFSVMLFPRSAVWNSLPRHLLELIMTSSPLSLFVLRERGREGEQESLLGWEWKHRGVREKRSECRSKENVRGKNVRKDDDRTESEVVSIHLFMIKCHNNTLVWTRSFLKMKLCFPYELSFRSVHLKWMCVRLLPYVHTSRLSPDNQNQN